MTLGRVKTGRPLMNLEIAAVVLTGVGVALGVLLGVWRIHAHYEIRNDAAHAELARKIENALSNVRGEITRVTLDLQHQITSVAKDVHYLRGWQDRQDRKD